MHLLVVQSHPGIQLGIAHLIRTFGYSVETANNLIDACSKMAPDVLIVDDVSALEYGMENLFSLWRDLDTPPEIILTVGSWKPIDYSGCQRRLKLVHQPVDTEALETDLERINRRRR